MTQLVKTPDNKLYALAPASYGPWLVCKPISVTEAKTIGHSWQGFRIPVDGLWQEILAFLEWSYQETKSETVVHLYYHETAGWAAIVLPQAGYNGMTIKLLEDHPGRAVAVAKLPPVETGAWELMGTVHHHCSSFAFQSDGDESDEKTKVGLHITVGSMGSNSYSLHGRCSHSQIITPCVWSDWFGLSADAERYIPAKYLDEILADALKVPAAKEQTFPAWWKDNIIKVAPPVWQGQQGSWHQGNFHQGHAGHVPVVQKAKWGAGYAGRCEDAVKEICHLTGGTLDDFLKWMSELEKQPWHLIIDALSENYAEPSDLVEAAEDMKREEMAKVDAETGEMETQIQKMDELESYRDGMSIVDEKSADDRLDERIGLAKALGLDPKEPLPDSDEEWATHFGID